MTRKVQITMDIALIIVVVLGMYVMLHLHKEPVGAPVPVPNVVLMDGGFEPGLGIYHETMPVNGVESYASSTLGIALDYPSSYLLFTGAYGAGTDAHEIITFMPATSTEWMIAAMRNGGGGTEGPASIGLAFFPKPSAGYAAIPAWLATHKDVTNFDPANDPATVLATTIIAGFPAYAYRTSLGMFAFDYRAFVAGDWLVVAWAEDNTDKDFDPILQSLHFSKPIDLSFAKAAAGATPYGWHAHFIDRIGQPPVSYTVFTKSETLLPQYGLDDPYGDPQVLAWNRVYSGSPENEVAQFYTRNGAVGKWGTMSGEKTFTMTASTTESVSLFHAGIVYGLALTASHPTASDRTAFESIVHWYAARLSEGSSL